MLEFSGNFHMQGRALEDPQKLGTQVTKKLDKKGHHDFSTLQTTTKWVTLACPSRKGDRRSPGRRNGHKAIKGGSVSYRKDIKIH